MQHLRRPTLLAAIPWLHHPRHPRTPGPLSVVHPTLLDQFPSRKTAPPEARIWAKSGMKHTTPRLVVLKVPSAQPLQVFPTLCLLLPPLQRVVDRTTGKRQGQHQRWPQSLSPLLQGSCEDKEQKTGPALCKIFSDRDPVPRVLLWELCIPRLGICDNSVNGMSPHELITHASLFGANKLVT